MLFEADYAKNYASIKMYYTPRLRKYRPVFREPSYSPRRSRGEYGEGNTRPVFPKPRGIRFLSQLKTGAGGTDV